MGNAAPISAHRVPVFAEDHTPEELAQVARDRGIEPLPDETPTQLAARASDVVRFRSVEGPRVTALDVGEDPTGALDVLSALKAGWPPSEDLPANRRGIWASHSSEPPAWVSCPQDPNLEGSIARLFGCPVGIPDDVEATHYTYSGPPGVGPGLPDDGLAPANEVTA